MDIYIPKRYYKYIWPIISFFTPLIFSLLAAYINNFLVCDLIPDETCALGFIMWPFWLLYWTAFIVTFPATIILLSYGGTDYGTDGYFIITLVMMFFYGLIGIIIARKREKKIAYINDNVKININRTVNTLTKSIIACVLIIFGLMFSFFLIFISPSGLFWLLLTAAYFTSAILFIKTYKPIYFILLLLVLLIAMIILFYKNIIL